MGQLCDFCGEQRSMVYCRSDAACLCLSCDRNVHSANALSRRHSRTLLCERCNSQSAIVRCVEEKISLCQSCDWNGHGSSTLGSAHKRQTINCYSGCPSAAELSRIWSSIIDSPSIDNSNCEQELGLMSIDDNSISNRWGPPEDNSMIDLSGDNILNELENMDKFGILMGSSSVPALNPIPYDVDQLAGSMDSTTPKLSCPGTKDLGLGEGDDLCEDFSVSDVDLNFENYEELFGISQNQSEQLFENGGLDNLFGIKDISGADSNYQDDFVAEGMSVGKIQAMQPTCSNAASADSMMSAKTEPNLYYPPRQAHSGLSISFSGMTGESSGGDYQDCGVSPALLMGEPPWHPPCAENSFPSTSRDSAVMRYKAKKKIRQ
nr:TPA_asm: hypothetical protein HUJ06_025303 [Nelumbo nucifera]